MQGLPGLAKANSFKSWLFTIAHNTAVTRAERAGRTAPLPVPSHDEAFGSFDVPDPSRLDNPELVAEDHEMAGLVWEAASALNARDYALLDLHVRQGLESAEIAQVLNVSKGNAYTMVSRMKTAAAEVIGGYVIARRGSKDCEELRNVIAPFDIPPYTEEARKAVDAHVRRCDVCQRARKSLVPLEIFGSFAAVPAPFALKGDIWRGLAGGWPWGDGAAIAAAGAADGPQEFVAREPDDEMAVAPVGAGGGGGGAPVLPIEGGGGEGGNRWVVFAVAVLGLLVVAFAVAGGLILAGAIGDDDGAAVADGRTATAEAGSPTLTPGVVVETPTPGEPTDTPEPEDEDTATATPEGAEPTDTPETEATDTPEADVTPTTPPRATNTPAGPTATPPTGGTPSTPPSPTPTFGIGR
jgi:RNA polymerase sigma factor (sigma-70 family)